MTRRLIFASLGTIFIVCGLIALTKTDVAVILLIVPAYPLARLSIWLDPSARSGVLWDTAHSPAFLTTLGMAVIYFLPGVALVFWSFWMRSRR